MPGREGNPENNLCGSGRARGVCSRVGDEAGGRRTRCPPYPGLCRSRDAGGRERPKPGRSRSPPPSWGGLFSALVLLMFSTLLFCLVRFSPLGVKWSFQTGSGSPPHSFSPQVPSLLTGLLCPLLSNVLRPKDRLLGGGIYPLFFF